MTNGTRVPSAVSLIALDLHACDDQCHIGTRVTTNGTRVPSTLYLIARLSLSHLLSCCLGHQPCPSLLAVSTINRLPHSTRVPHSSFINCLPHCARVPHSARVPLSSTVFLIAHLWLTHLHSGLIVSCRSPTCSPASSSHALPYGMPYDLSLTHSLLVLILSLQLHALP